MDQHLLQALQALGNTEEEVAEKLRSHGIKGRSRLAGSCPVANYLRHVAGFDTVCIYDSAEVTLDKRGYSEATPEPVFAFICSFDRGGYPDLEESS